jgi:hypothetical protein
LPGLGPLCRPADHPDQTVNSVTSVSFLGAKSTRMDNQNSALSHTPANQMNQTLANVVRQVWGVGHIKTEFYSRRNFVDILTARS